MPNRRTLILNRIEEVLGEITPARDVYRNRADLDASDRPCRILLDGSERVHHNYENRAGRVYARTAPSVMLMEPEIFELLRVRVPNSSGEYAPELALAHDAIHYAMINDSELVALTGVSGDIVYRGCDTDMHNGGTKQGELQMFFRFYYVLDPTTDLA